MLPEVKIWREDFEQVMIVIETGGEVFLLDYEL